MSDDQNDVIDLTESFDTLINHCHFSNAVIEVDDSIYVVPPDSPELPERRRSRSSLRNPNSTKNLKATKKDRKRLSSHSSQTNEKTKRIGDCPVCWDELGKNALASTKCGHIFCLHCIEQVVKQTKSCPTCRCPLKGASAYHPLYLSL